ncbi:MAG: TonB-dependent receptor [Candidatus Marinimicrobia bacterium]|nr:TonB-dependent receptor [Candidatus Neomarinimicrobiota bacterium]MBT4947945.1 TonB-dependent receptor [Candidatus Neomarinimicrobiota bacterium]MBT5268135.1 TonB-dependent receptor [Candidatus Neomarinimicrobiota bacterium]MBT6011014.1 TonB-dependent receptor [Candidatus Neomarinimicrobiota bacterium]
MKKSFIRLLILLLAVPMLFGQLNSISGTIRNSITLEPLPYANLVIKGTYLGGTSNVDGYFYLSGLSHDSLQVVCSYMGYNSFSKQLFFEDDTHIIIPIHMEPQTLGGEEVVVVDSLLYIPEHTITSQLPGPEQPKDIELMETEELEQNGFSYELLAPTRWLHPTGEFTKYVIDGVPVENTRHLYNIYPAFNLDAVKHIENHGAGNVRQTTTDPISTTELIYKEGNRANPDVRAILGLVESGLTTSGPHPAGGSWYFSGRRVDFDAIYSLSTTQSDSVYRRFKPDYYFYDLNGKITFDISDNTKVSGNMYLTFDKLHWLGAQGRSAHSSWYNSFISGRIQHRFSPRLAILTNLYGRNYHTFLRADQIPFGLSKDLNGDFTNDLSTYGVSTHAEYFLGRNNMVSAGMSADLVNSDVAYVDSSALKDVSGLIFKARAGYRYTLPYNLSTDVGLQTVYSSFTEKLAVNPSLRVDWDPSNIYSAYFSLVQSTPTNREISLSNTLSQPLLDILIPVDKSFEMPSEFDVSFGGRFMPRIGYDVSAEIFTQLLENPTLLDSNWQGDFSAQDKWLVPYESGLVSGLNLSLEKLTPGVRTLAKYRFSTATLTDSAGVKDLLPGHRQHEFYFTLDGKFRDNMGYKLDFSLASGKRYFDTDQDWKWSSAYHRLDLSFYREVSWERVNGKISLKLINLTNRKNFDFDENSWVTNSLQDRTFVLLPFMPTINFDFIF